MNKFYTRPFQKQNSSALKKWGKEFTTERTGRPGRHQHQSSRRWISPIMIRLLDTLNPRRAGSSCLPFFPFFLPLRPDCMLLSDDSGAAGPLVASASGTTGFLSTSMNEVSGTAVSLQDEVRLNLISFLPDGWVSAVVLFVIGLPAGFCLPSEITSVANKPQYFELITTK